MNIVNMISSHYLIINLTFSNIIYVLLVLSLILEVDLFELKCPENLQRHVRVKLFCNTSFLYSCLFDENNNTFTESCIEKTNFVRPGQQYVIRDFRTNAECYSSTYQPIKFWAHKYSTCIFLKSKCNEIGQMLYDNRSTAENNACRCDHNDGYAFLVQPMHANYCIPTEEDCTCFKKICPSNTNLSTDYNCISIPNSTGILPDREYTHTTIASNTSRTGHFKNSSMETVAPTFAVLRAPYPRWFLLITVGIIIGLTACAIIMTECCGRLMKKKDEHSANYMKNVSTRKSMQYTVSSSATSIKVRIDKTNTECMNDIIGFEIRYSSSVSVSAHHVSKRYATTQSMEKDGLEIDGLESSTMYSICIYWCDVKNKHHHSWEGKQTTKKSNANFLKSKSVPIKPGVFMLKNVPNNKRVKKGDDVREIDIINEYKPTENKSDEITLLLIGPIGSGISTLINALMNYIAGVSFNDGHRFALIIEKSAGENKMGHKDTPSFVIYRIPKITGSKVNYKLNIITTRLCHQKITSRIKTLCEDMETTLDAIVIVVSSETTLTDKQRYDFSKISDADLSRNVFVAITFCDKKNKEECQTQLDRANINYKHVLEFDNSNILSIVGDTRRFSLNLSNNEKRWENRRNTLDDIFRKLRN